MVFYTKPDLKDYSMNVISNSLTRINAKSKRLMVDYAKLEKLVLKICPKSQKLFISSKDKVSTVVSSC